MPVEPEGPSHPELHLEGPDDAPVISDASRAVRAREPLAVRMRPRTLAEVIGQDAAMGPGTPLRRLVEGSGGSSVILYGPPGTGKTTLAGLISSATGRHFVALSALSAGVKEVRAVIAEAKRRLTMEQQTVLFIDEVHRFSKTQQDALLAAVENRTVLLVAATTENPSFSVVAPLLSRSLIVRLTPLGSGDIVRVVERAVADPRGLGGSVALDTGVADQLAELAAGDARRALTYLEAAADTAGDTAADTAAGGAEKRGGPAVVVTAEHVARAADRAVLRYDRSGDQHYDVTSALIKSIRGSDADAALHYLARMIEAGEDPRFIARRLIILASEDIGLADPDALGVAVAAHQAVQAIGMPEGRLTLAQATVHLALAPKSNAVYAAYGRAVDDVRRGRGSTVPPHLRDGHYAGAKRAGNALGYLYPHDHPHGVVPQSYLPEDLAGARYYRPAHRGQERSLAQRWEKLIRIIRSG